MLSVFRFFVASICFAVLCNLSFVRTVSALHVSIVYFFNAIRLQMQHIGSSVLCFHGEFLFEGLHRLVVYGELFFAVR